MTSLIAGLVILEVFFAPLPAQTRAANREDPERWESDTAQSVEMYNRWFRTFSPEAFQQARAKVAREVSEALEATNDLRELGPEALRKCPRALAVLRMATGPPLARDRLCGLTGIPRSMVDRMEREGKLPARMDGQQLQASLQKLGDLLGEMTDPHLCPWRGAHREPSGEERRRLLTVLADRLCRTRTDTILRNAQEARQLGKVADWLNARGYHLVKPDGLSSLSRLPSAAFCLHQNVPAAISEKDRRTVNISIDVVIMPKAAEKGRMPLLLELKSAGDFTNVNKRRKEEAKKMAQLRQTYGKDVAYVLFLCGYFNRGYLDYEAAAGIDWVWEHRVDDLAELGL